MVIGQKVGYARVSTYLSLQKERLFDCDQELDTSSPTERLIFHVLAVIGEFERELVVEVSSSKAGAGFA